MNERIKELAEQSGLVRGGYANSPEKIMTWRESFDNPGSLEKFAELILTDVFQHLTDTGHDYCREILEKRYDMVDPRFAEYLKEQYERTNC